MTPLRLAALAAVGLALAACASNPAPRFDPNLAPAVGRILNQN